jgi:hypothetical protein
MPEQSPKRERWVRTYAAASGRVPLPHGRGSDAGPVVDAPRSDSAAPHGQAALQRQIDATDRQIDRLVYELYGLTDEEIRIVEEAAGR